MRWRVGLAGEVDIDSVDAKIAAIQESEGLASRAADEASVIGGLAVVALEDQRQFGGGE